MTRIQRTMLIVVCGMLFAAAPINGHHNANAKYDPSKPITLKGTVTKVEWMNPHIYIYVDAADQGRKANWAVEGATPNQLYRRGWRRDSVKIGDTVTIEGLRARQAGLKHVNARSVVLADGRKVFSGSAEDGLSGRAGAPPATRN